MELYKEMLIQIIKSEEIDNIFPSLKIRLDELIEKECYQALNKIRSILEDETLNDKECFIKIEEIICLFENIAGGCETRHDF